MASPSDQVPRSPEREIEKGHDSSSSDGEPSQFNAETDLDMRIEQDYGICQIETEKERQQLPGARSALDRVLSRTSVADKDPGPPPDGGFWAWSSGKRFLATYRYNKADSLAIAGHIMMLNSWYELPACN
ncbi:hypothetical protein ACHAPO_004777 [Fusarium lateritium]